MTNKPQSKSKLKMPFTLSSKDKDRVKRACATAVDVLNSILQIANDVAGNAGVPGLQAGISGLQTVLAAIKKASQNAADVEKLVEYISGLNDALQTSKRKGKLSQDVISRIDKLAMLWNMSDGKVQEIVSRNFFGRVMHQSGDAEVISGFIQRISQSVQTFTVESLAIIQGAVDRIERNTEQILSNLTQTSELNFLTILCDICLVPPHALSAPFDSKDRVQCLEGTRTDILHQVHAWIDLQPNRAMTSTRYPDHTDRQNPLIFWINGSAGTGKTTIAYTVAEECRRQNILGASFFCSRDDANCSSPRLIFTTIAYQLGNFCPALKEKIAISLKSNPDIGYSEVSYQLQKLVVEPLSELGTSFPFCVIVIDALDECKDDQATSTILTSLSQYVTGLSQLKFLVTSRPERNITWGFESSNLEPSTQRLVLHDLRLEVVERDIMQYLQVKLAEIRGRYKLEERWPSMEDIKALAQMSAGLFIFAATSVKYIAESDPEDQMLALLHSSITDVEELSPQGHLDQLYTQVLTHAFPNIKPPLAQRLRMILGTIALLQDLLSVSGLEQMILKNFKKGTVRQTLVQLHSVVIVPDKDEQVIRFIHPSFFDYITNPERCTNTNFVINSRDQHTVLAEACLEVMKGLRKDICNIGNTSLLNGEVGDLQERKQEHIPDFLQYACRHWATHLADAVVTEAISALLEEFCTKSLLHWVEVCALIGGLQNALSSLEVAQKALMKQSDTQKKLVDLLYDCWRFVLEFFDIISMSTLQVYESALCFAPVETAFFKTYKHELGNKMRVFNAVEEEWNPCMRTMEGHSSVVTSVAFSPDGTKVVSGSWDNTVRLWDAVSGAHLNTLTGHSNWVTSVAFSPDGTKVVSGSRDKTVRLWDAVSGAHLNTLTGHSQTVTSVAFSPDGTKVVSGSDDNTVRLWDAVSGAHLNTLTGHSNRVTSVAFSPDGTKVVSGSYDETVRLWDAVSGAHLNTLTGHSEYVTSVAFSPDGTKVVSGSDDNTVRLWDAVSGAHLNTLTGHSNRVTSVAFSPDGTKVVSGSDDNTVRLWDAVSGAHLNTLPGHSDWVASVAFSPDGAKVVSGSWDKTVRLWDAVSGAHLNTLTGHSQTVTSVAFSPDGTKVVSGSDDNTVRLWDAVSGAHLNTLTGHSQTVTSVAFSPDGTKVVSGSWDKTVRLWDAVSGAHLNTLTGHSDYVTSVAFSPDGTKVVSGSWDNTVRLWDAVSGAHLNTLTGHSQTVTSVAFSPDGTKVVSGSDDKTVRLWDAVSGAHLNTLTGHSDDVTSVSFSPDGNLVVSRSYEDTLTIWNAQNGALIHPLNPGLLSTSLASDRRAISDVLHQTGQTFVLQDGWITFRATGRRLLWLPVQQRGLLSFTKDCIALGTANGRVVILHLDSTDDVN